nr:unnamed protein product [Digitaria exilis]
MERPSLITKIGFAVLACNSALAIRNSRGDVASVAFVLAADAALVLLFLGLRRFDRGGGDGGGAGRMIMDRQYSALAMVGLSVLNCTMALDAYASGPGSTAWVFISYVVLVFVVFKSIWIDWITVRSCPRILRPRHNGGDTHLAGRERPDADTVAFLCLCLRRFERAGGGRSTKAAVWALTTLLTAMFASRVAPLMPQAVAAIIWALAAATVAAGLWAFFLA